MMSRKVEVKFKVFGDTQPGETVCVVGSCAELGNWLPNKAVRLNLERKQNNRELWSQTILLSVDHEIRYRYFMAHVIEAEHEGDDMDVMIRRWETNRSPRKLNVRAYFLNSEESDIDEAVFGEYNGKKSVGKGWLTGQTEIHLRLHSEPIHMWKHRYQQQKYSIHCTPLDLRYRDVSLDMEEEDSSHDMPTMSRANVVYGSILNGTDDLPHEQPQFGLYHEENSYMVFRTQTFNPEFLGYQMDFYIYNPNAGPNEIPKLVGHSYILPVSLTETTGIKTVPINGMKNKPIGQIKVEYLIIKPLKDTICDMSVTYANYWNQHRPLDVGHRGMGVSYAQECAAVRENTIASLSEAGGHGADFVEFDVMLSSDNVPVIYHNFTVCLSLKQKGTQNLRYFEIPVQELTYAQLQRLKVDHVSEKCKGEESPNFPYDVLDPEDTRPFPTLRQGMESVDPHIGFNIEIKYCMELKCGGMEDGLKHFQERNRYVDIILSEVLRHGGSRRIVFSSFDPDICTMIRMKQNLYPVQFLCYGPTKKFPSYRDPRSSDMKFAIFHAHSEEYLGVNMHTEDLFRDISLLTFAKSHGLIVLAWGDDNNEKANIKRLKEIGVDGVIYDRIHELKDPANEKVYCMEPTEEAYLLKNVGTLMQVTSEAVE